MLLIGLLATWSLALLGQQLAARPQSPQITPEPTTTSLFATTTQPNSAAQQTPAQTILTRNDSGGFALTAQVNNLPASFVVDTGADLVSLTEEDARRLGLPVDKGQMRPMLRTADGMADAQTLRIPRLAIGTQVMRDVPAVVVPGLQVNLLGESALSRLRRVVLSGDRMVIEPD